MENQDNHNLMRSEARKYNGLLDEEEIERACLRAMWRCLGNHDDSHESGQKFTTSLFRFLQWELNRSLKAQQNTRKNIVRRDVHDIPEKSLKPTKQNRRTNSPETEAMAGFLLDLGRQQLKTLDMKIVELHFLEGMTAEEVGERVGMKKERVRNRIEFAVRRLRTLAERTPIGSVFQMKHDPEKKAA